MYTVIDHTADIGIEVKAASLSQLFEEAARAMFDLLISSKRTFIPSIEVPIAIEAAALDELLVRWLSELLFLFETRRLVQSRFWIDEIDERHVQGSVKGQKFDAARHVQKLDIKAVTYHQIKVAREADGTWVARVIFDI